MSALQIIHDLKKFYNQFKVSPDEFRVYLKNVYAYIRGFGYAQDWSPDPRQLTEKPDEAGKDSGNPLLHFFRNNQAGPGIWKWEHYFEIYERHFSSFVDKQVNVLEIGVYSGGSLKMWKSYFGDNSHIYGVDIEPDCMTYEREGVTIKIGDQKDREFWKYFRDSVPDIDILIDDGGHKPEQQMVTLEEMLPHIRSGGVYFCEDIHGLHHEFISFASGLISEINRSVDSQAPSDFQKCIHSIHFYPYLLVIEKHKVAPRKFHAPKFGTEWQPFFDQKKKEN